MSSPGGPKNEYRSAQREGEIHISLPTAAAELSAARIAAWLLHAGVQQDSGPHAGGVAGILDANGRAEYIYPEIAGYYLHWLAWYTATAGHDVAVATRAMAAQRWVGSWLSSGEHPATRVYLAGGATDWRNGALFFFDYAMLLRGLALASGQRIVAADPWVVDALLRQLARLLAPDGMFNACVATQRGSVLPDRWSTRRGGFLAKAAAGILIAGRELCVPPVLMQAADTTFVASIRSAVDCPHAEIHPFLYTVEGVLSIPEHPAFVAALDALRPQLRTLFAMAEAGGRVPESFADSGADRMDIVAQALRVGLRLRAAGRDDIVGEPALRQLSRRLIDEINSDGALPFDARRVPTQANVWAAMFAQQALSTMPREGEHDAGVAHSVAPALGLT